jgi:hypothetical protein
MFAEGVIFRTSSVHTLEEPRPPAAFAAVRSIDLGFDRHGKTPPQVEPQLVAPPSRLGGYDTRNTEATRLWLGMGTASRTHTDAR